MEFSQYSAHFLVYFLGLLSLCFKARIRCSARRISAGSSVWFVLRCRILLASSLFFSTPKSKNCYLDWYLLLFPQMWVMFIQRSIKGTLTTKLLEVVMLCYHMGNVVCSCMHITCHTLTCIPNSLIPKGRECINPCFYLKKKKKKRIFHTAKWSVGIDVQLHGFD